MFQHPVHDTTSEPALPASPGEDKGERSLERHLDRLDRYENPNRIEKKNSGIEQTRKSGYAARCTVHSTGHGEW
jgi:hypothetical protein